MNNLIPFSIEKQKTGDYDVIYRNGEVPLEWHWFEKAKEHDKLKSVNRFKTFLHHYENGSIICEETHGYDLMLKPKEKWMELEIRSDGINSIFNRGNNPFNSVEIEAYPYLYRIRINQTNPNECSIEKI